MPCIYIFENDRVVAQYYDFRGVMIFFANLGICSYLQDFQIDYDNYDIVFSEN